MRAFARADVARCLADGFIAAAGTKLREEDETKANELVAFLDEIARAVAKTSKRERVVIVDAAAGKGYVGVLAAKLVLEASGRTGEVVMVEREAGRLDAARQAAGRLGVTTPIVTHACDVDDASAYPEGATIVAALHACGDASDRVIERAIACGAKHALVVPCCVGKSTRGVALAESVARAIHLPRVAPIDRRLVHAVVDGERVLTLEAAGYQTEAVEFVPPRVSPYNVLLRARRVGEPVRMERAKAELDALRASAGTTLASP